jgi:hypothetical protein
MAVKVHIQLLRQSERFRESLQNDGWVVEAKRYNDVFASHPAVKDEVDARSRLQQLGFLTSGSMRIEFATGWMKGGLPTEPAES